MDLFWKPSICLLLALFVVKVELAAVPPESAWPAQQKFIMSYHIFIDSGYKLCKDIAANRIRNQDLNTLIQLAPEHKDQVYIDFMRDWVNKGIEVTTKTLAELKTKADEWVKESQKRLAEKNEKKTEYGYLKDIPDIFGAGGRCPLKE